MDVHNCQSEVGWLIRSLISDCTHLMNLSLTNLRSNDDDLAAFSTLPQLNHLTSVELFFTYSQRTYDVLKKMKLMELPLKLIHLDINNGERRFFVMESLAVLPPSQLETIEIQTLGPGDLNQLVACAPKLKFISLMECHLPDLDVLAQFEGLQTIEIRLHNSILLHQPLDLVESQVIHGLVKCKHLTSLRFDIWHPSSLDSWSQLAISFATKLVSLEFSSRTPNSFEVLLPFESLTTLKFSGISSPIEFTQIHSYFRSSSLLPNLRLLELTPTLWCHSQSWSWCKDTHMNTDNYRVADPIALEPVAPLDRPASDASPMIKKELNHKVVPFSPAQTLFVDGILLVLDYLSFSDVISGLLACRYWYTSGLRMKSRSLTMNMVTLAKNPLGDSLLTSPLRYHIGTIDDLDIYHFHLIHLFSHIHTCSIRLTTKTKDHTVIFHLPDSLTSLNIFSESMFTTFKRHLSEPDLKAYQQLINSLPTGARLTQLVFNFQYPHQIDLSPLKQMPSLTDLNLSLRMQYRPVAQSICEELPLKKFKFTGLTDVNFQLFHPQSKFMSTIEEWDWSERKPTKVEWESLATNPPPHLRTLKMIYDTDRPIFGLSALNLTSLTFSANLASDANYASQIGQCRSLTYLYLNYVSRLDDGDLCMILASLDRLEYFKLQNTEPVHLTRSLQFLPCHTIITKLYIELFSSLTKNLIESPRLEILELTHLGFVGLTVQSISSNEFIQFFESIPQLCRLRIGTLNRQRSQVDHQKAVLGQSKKDVPASRLVGIEMNPGPTSVTPTNQTAIVPSDEVTISPINDSNVIITHGRLRCLLPQTLFNDGLQIIFSYLNQTDWVTTLLVCHHWSTVSAGTPSRHLRFPINSDGSFACVLSPRMVHHFFGLNPMLAAACMSSPTCMANHPSAGTPDPTVIGQPSAPLTSQTLFVDGILSFFGFLSFPDLIPALHTSRYWHSCGLKERCRQLTFDCNENVYDDWRENYPPIGPFVNLVQSPLNFHITTIRHLSMDRLLTTQRLPFKNLHTLHCYFKQRTDSPLIPSVTSPLLNHEFALPPALRTLHIEIIYPSNTFASCQSFIDAIPTGSQITSLTFLSSAIRFFDLSPIQHLSRLTSLDLNLPDGFTLDQQRLCASLPLTKLITRGLSKPDWIILHPSSPLMTHLSEINWGDWYPKKQDWLHLAAHPPPKLESLIMNVLPTGPISHDLTSFKLTTLRLNTQQTYLPMAFDHEGYVSMITDCRSSLTSLCLNNTRVTNSQLSQILAQLPHLVSFTILGDWSGCFTGFELLPPIVCWACGITYDSYDSFEEDLLAAAHLESLTIGRLFFQNDDTPPRSNSVKAFDADVVNLELRLPQVCVTLPKLTKLEIEAVNGKRVRFKYAKPVNSQQPIQPHQVDPAAENIVGIEPPASPLVGIESNPGPSGSGPSVSPTAQTVFNDALHLIYSYLTQVDFLSAIQSCQHWSACGSTCPSQEWSFLVEWDGTVKAPPPARLAHHWTRLRTEQEMMRPCMSVKQVLTIGRILPGITKFSCSISDRSYSSEPSVVEPIWPRVLTTIDLVLNSPKFPNLIQPLSTCPTLTHLAIWEVSRLIDFRLFTYIQFMPRLKHFTLTVELSDYPRSNDLLKAMELRQLPTTLTYINICHGFKSYFTVNTLAAMKLPNLTDIGLSRHILTQRNLKLLFLCAPNLNRIYAEEYSIESLTQLNLFKSLQEITLYDPSYMFTMDHHEALIVSGLCACPSLTSVILSEWRPQLVDSWKQLAHSLINLTKLKLIWYDDFAADDPPDIIPESLDVLLLFHQLTDLTFRDREPRILHMLEDYFRSSLTMPNLHRLSIGSHLNWNINMMTKTENDGDAFRKPLPQTRKIGSGDLPNHTVGILTKLSIKAADSNQKEWRDRNINSTDSTLSSVSDQLPPKDLTREGIEPHPGPTSLNHTGAMRVTPQTIFKDALHIIYSYLNLSDWLSSMYTCHHWYSSGCSQPNRQFAYVNKSLPVTSVDFPVWESYYHTKSSIRAPRSDYVKPISLPHFNLHSHFICVMLVDNWLSFTGDECFGAIQLFSNLTQIHAHVCKDASTSQICQWPHGLTDLFLNLSPEPFPHLLTSLSEHLTQQLETLQISGFSPTMHLNQLGHLNRFHRLTKLVLNSRHPANLFQVKRDFWSHLPTSLTYLDAALSEDEPLCHLNDLPQLLQLNHMVMYQLEEDDLDSILVIAPNLKQLTPWYPFHRKHLSQFKLFKSLHTIHFRLQPNDFNMNLLITHLSECQALTCLQFGGWVMFFREHWVKLSEAVPGLIELEWNPLKSVNSLTRALSPHIFLNLQYLKVCGIYYSDELKSIMNNRLICPKLIHLRLEVRSIDPFVFDVRDGTNVDSYRLDPSSDNRADGGEPYSDPPMDLTKEGVEPNPGPFQPHSSHISAQTIFRDGLHVIYSYLTLRDWRSCICTCQNWFNAGATEPPRHLSFPIERIHEPVSKRLQHHVTNAHAERSLGSQLSVSCKQLIEILQALPCLTKLSITMTKPECDITSPTTVPWPTTLTSLTLSLGIQRLPNLIHSLARLRMIQYLNINHRTDELDWCGYHFIQELSQLKDLTLFLGDVKTVKNPYKLAQWTYLPSTLTRLNICQTYRVELFRSLIALPPLHHLQYLDLLEHELHTGDLELIFQFAPNLTGLDTYRFCVDDFQMILHFKHLQSITFSRPPFSSNLAVSDAEVENSVVSVLCGCTQLTHISFLGWCCAPDSFQSLADHLANLESFTLGSSFSQNQLPKLQPFSARLKRLQMEGLVCPYGVRQLDSIDQFIHLEEFVAILPNRDWRDINQIKEWFASPQICPNLKRLFIHVPKSRYVPHQFFEWDAQKGIKVDKFSAPKNQEPTYRSTAPTIEQQSMIEPNHHDTSNTEMSPP